MILRPARSVPLKVFTAVTACTHRTTVRQPANTDASKHKRFAGETSAFMQVMSIAEQHSKQYTDLLRGFELDNTPPL